MNESRGRFISLFIFMSRNQATPKQMLDAIEHSGRQLFSSHFQFSPFAGHPSDNGKFKENGELIFWVRYVGRQVGLQFCMSLFFL